MAQLSGTGKTRTVRRSQTIIRVFRANRRRVWRVWTNPGLIVRYVSYEIR